MYSPVYPSIFPVVVACSQSFSTSLLSSSSVIIHNFLREKLKIFGGKASVQRLRPSNWPKQHKGYLHNGLKIVHKFYFLVVVNFLFGQPGHTGWYFVLLVAAWLCLDNKNNVHNWDSAAEWSESFYESESVEFSSSTLPHCELFHILAHVFGVMTRKFLVMANEIFKTLCPCIWWRWPGPNYVNRTITHTSSNTMKKFPKKHFSFLIFILWKFADSSSASFVCIHDEEIPSHG